MYLRKPTKGDQYYDIAMDLYFNKGVGVTQITRQIPVARSMIYRWITKFAIENGLKESSDMRKDIAKGQSQSTLQEGQSGSTDDVQVLRARIEELEEQLRHEKMRAEAYNTMIDLAESTFKVPIRKKIWRQTVETLHAKDSKRYPVESLSKLFGKSKQAYYKRDEDVVLRKAAQEAFVVEYVHSIRAIDPGIGGMKLWTMYKHDFGDNDTVGRDRFEDILDKHKLKVKLRMRKPRTTDSTHGLPTFPNLIKELIPTRPNQLWVSYLSLILDAYTEEIIGWSVGPTLETVYPLEALEMALKRLDGIEKVDLIHHSDRGVQYASSEYVRILRGRGIRISMTESGDPKENAQEERINNTMKNELLKGKRFTDIVQVREAVAKAVDFYNFRRPHMSINMMTPAEAALCEGVLEKWWVSYREKAVRAILEKQALETGENNISLSAVQGSPSGLRPSVNP